MHLVRINKKNIQRYGFTVKPEPTTLPPEPPKRQGGNTFNFGTKIIESIMNILSLELTCKNNRI